jgi:hypothetical protein
MICNARKSLAPGRCEGLMRYAFKSGYTEHVCYAVEQNDAYHPSAALQMPCVPSSSQTAPLVFGNRWVGTSDTTVHSFRRHVVI